MDNRITNLLYLLMLLILAGNIGCAGKPKTYVVLLDSLDGTVGEITITNEKGSQKIDQAGYAVGMNNKGKPLGKPFQIDKKEIESDFGRTMAVSPDPPIKFILYFHPDTTILTEESEQLVKQVLPAVSARKFPTIGITGHTDLVGEKGYNKRLAMRRAEAIQELLVTIDIDPSNISLTSHGENNPLVQTPDGVPEPRNRRVEVIVR